MKQFIRDWNLAFVQKVQICTNLALLTMFAVREMALKNEVVIGKSEVENSRKQLRLLFGRRRNWDPHSGCSLAKITYSYHCQSILWTSSETHHTEIQVLLLGTQITFSCSDDFCFRAKAMKSETIPISHSCILPWAK